MANNTLAQIKQAVYSRLSEKDTSSTYDYTTKVLPKINSVQRKICYGEYKDIIRTTVNSDIIYKAGDLRFLRSKIYISKLAGMPTTSAVNAGDGVVNVSTVNFTTTGFVMMNNNIFSYTGVTGTQLTGCSGIIVDSVTGTTVEQVYQIPATASRTFQLFNLFPDNNVNEIEYQDSKFNRNSAQYYTVIEDQGTTNNFVYIKGVFTYSKFLLYYYNAPTDLVALSDITVLPDNSGVEFLANLTAGELLVETEETEDGKAKLQLGYAQLHDFYRQWTEINKKFRGKVEWAKNNIQYGGFGFGNNTW